MTPYQAYKHCLEHGRNPELEKIILINSYFAYKYSLYIVKGRLIEAEKIILTDPEWACHYAEDVIRDRWNEAENIIATDSYCAYRYAKLVIKGKLPEHMHNMMLLHADDFAKHYLDFINN